jgi:hypothetical protein
MDAKHILPAMYVPHEAFDTPEDIDSPVWRYMDFAKLVDMLESETLYFSRADRLGDPFEGSYSEANLRLRPDMYGEGSASLVERFSELMREMPRFTIVSCWHLSEYESAAMWEKYAAAGYAIAIQSSFNRLTSSLNCKEPVHVGIVKYLDYVRDVIPESNTFYPFLHKRLSFEHELEIRAIIQGISKDRHGNLDFDRDSWEAGRPISVNLSTLIERIYVAPSAPGWFISIVDRMQRRLGLTFDVQRSDLARDPVY